MNILNMELDMTSVVIFVAILILTTCITLRPKSKIPGPIAWPLIGNLFIFKKIQNSRSFQGAVGALSKKYGSVFRLFLGPYEVVYVCDFKIIRQVLKEQAENFVDRPSWLPTIQLGQKVKNGIGLAWSNGDLWKNVRRLTLSSMRDFGVGKTSLEEKIIEEAENIIEVFEKLKGKPVNNVREIMTKASCNVIHHIIFGYRYKHDDPKLIELTDHFHNLFATTGSLSADSIYPFLRIIFSSSRSNRQRKSLAHIAEYVSEQIKNHTESFDENNIRDFVDIYLKSENLQNEKEEKAGKGQLFSVIIDLFAAGTDTTSTTLDWCLLYMIGNPAVQSKCQEEIARVVGSGRMVRTADRPNLPYVEATLMEVQRLGNTASGSLPHMATCDTTVGGYPVKKGTIVMSMFSLTHKDEAIWPNAEKFDPDRFLDENGKIKKKDTLMPFGAGPRVCPGESLAKTEMFLIFTNLLQRFSFSKVDPSDELSFVGITGITTVAPPYRLNAQLR